MKIGIIGLGVMGKNHLRVLNNIEHVEVGGLCDPVATLDSPLEIYKDLPSLLQNGAPDAAIVAVPTPNHPEVVERLIAEGIPLLIEKPAASSSAAAKEMVNQAEAGDIRCAVGHIERFNPVVDALKKEVADKEIYSISFTRVGPFPPRIGDVGVLTDLSVHDIDLARFITGREFEDMQVFKSRKIVNHSEDNAEISFRLQDDIVGNITTNWLTPFKRRKIEVACKEAYYEADLMSQELMEYSGYERNNSYVSRWCFVQKGEPLRRELEAFINYLQTGRIGNLATIEDSVKTLEILERYA